LAGKYDQAFAGIDGIVVPRLADGADSAWHLYVIRLEPEKFKAARKLWFEALRAENIGVQVHYIPVYRHPYYERLGYGKELCPQAERYYETAISLPLYPAMTEADADTVIEAVRKVSRHFHI
jgi:perosamine synthetase